MDLPKMNPVGSARHPEPDDAGSRGPGSLAAGKRAFLLRGREFPGDDTAEAARFVLEMQVHDPGRPGIRGQDPAYTYPDRGNGAAGVGESRGDQEATSGSIARGNRSMQESRCKRYSGRPVQVYDGNRRLTSSEPEEPRA